MFLTDTAEELLKRKEVLKVPVIMGITNHEFGWILPQVTQISMLSFQTFRHNVLYPASVTVLLILIFMSMSLNFFFIYPFLKGTLVGFFLFLRMYFILN